MLKKTLFALAAVFSLAGCTSFDYIGRKFPAYPESHMIKIFRNENQVPAGEYLAMGRGTLTARRTYDRYDVEDKLIKLGNEYGADAVLIVSEEKIFKSFALPDDGDFAGPSTSSLNPLNVAPDGESLVQSSFGTQVTENYGVNTTIRPETSYYGKTITEVRVIFLRKSDDMKKLLEERSKQIEEKSSSSVTSTRNILINPAPVKVPERAEDLQQ
jgi:hypothetical protein